MQNDTEKKEYLLLRLAKNGDERALSSIVAKYLPAIRKYARYAVTPGLDFDDAVQEGLIGLFRAIQTYRKDASASFTTYANICIQNAIFSAQRAAGRKKHRPLNQSISFSDDNIAAPDPEENTIAGENLSLVLKKAQVLLSSLEQQVLYLTLRGYSKREIAKKNGISLKSVENTFTRMRNKLK